jgi:hypothetical protein
MWDIEIGQTLKRRDVHARYGGQMQGGISTPTDSESILIFTDPRSGARYGYDKHEGLREDGSYAYTGEGQIGDQQFLRGNKAILDSPKSGRTIRLFRVEGTLATYAGGFTLGEPEYEEKQALDVEGKTRKVIIFNLVPINADVTVLPAYGGITKVISRIEDWRAPEWGSYEIAQSAKSEAPVHASRVEFELQSAFGNWLISKGHKVKKLSIKIGKSTIHPDLFDETTNTIIEAKRSASRGHVREAIGQVLDYRNNELIAGNDRSPAILLPGKPAHDLVALSANLNIQIYVPLDSENFGIGFEIVEP